MTNRDTLIAPARAETMELADLPVHAALRRLDGELGTLTDQIEATASRLEPVLGPSVPEPAESKDTAAPRDVSQTAATIMELTYRVTVCRERLGRLVSRLEI
jgi:hypothetical protein